jgi:transcriptional regulator with XRE-family HTH domain
MDQEGRSASQARAKFACRFDEYVFAYSQLAMATKPTRPGLELARMLRALREESGWNTFQAAEFIGKHVTTYRKFEAGVESPSKGDLRSLLNEWSLDGEELQIMLELCTQAKLPDWTSRFRYLPEAMRRLLGFENLATSIKAYENAAVFGPVQTEAYARFVIRACTPGATEEEIERQVELRMERQQRSWTNSPPELQLILSEAVIRSAVGGPQVMAGQLRHLVALPERCQLRVLPLRGPANPGMLGPFCIFEFEASISAPTVYVENRRVQYLSDPDTVDGTIADFNDLWDRALSAEDSLAAILEAIEELSR